MSAMEGKTQHIIWHWQQHLVCIVSLCEVTRQLSNGNYKAWGIMQAVLSLAVHVWAHHDRHEKQTEDEHKKHRMNSRLSQNGRNK